MSRPRLLDLFCGAGGAAMGYHRAGFEVVGVDINPQPHYPFEFHRGDAFAALAASHLSPFGPFDAIHASPPCQAHTALRTMPNAKQHLDLLTPTRPLLEAARKPWVIENVEGAPMRRDIELCGTMFGLGTGSAELRRHRWFEVGGWPAPVLAPPHAHYLRGKTVGVYGGGGKDNRRTRPATVGVWGKAGGTSVRDGVQQFSTTERAEAMGIDWMTGAELSQAIPPAYTEWIGAQLMAHLSRVPAPTGPQEEKE